MKEINGITFDSDENIKLELTIIDNKNKGKTQDFDGDFENYIEEVKKEVKELISIMESEIKKNKNR